MDLRKIKNLTICQLNIEGISKDKCDFLSRMAMDHHVDVIVLQETHAPSDFDLLRRGKITGFILIDSIDNGIYGSATYVRSSLNNYEFIEKSESNGIYSITIKVVDTYITNIYKPPNTHWPENYSAKFNHPAVYIGDFNCHHNLWGYVDNDRNGLALVHWMEMNNLHLIFDGKDRKSFYSARWKREYNPDLCFVTLDGDSLPLQTTRSVLSGFPNSQHRPVILKIGVNLDAIPCIQKPRWNFQKGNWNEYRKQVNSDLRWIPPTSENYTRFVGVIKQAAKKFVPRGLRKEYIPCWTNETNDLYKDFVANPVQEKSKLILDSLNKRRKEKWNTLMQSINFTHSSRSSWSLLRKLGAASQAMSSKEGKMKPNVIASRLVAVSKLVKLDKCEKRKMKRKLRKQRRMNNRSTNLAEPFNLEELMTTISSLKGRKAAGFDGIFPEFVKHLQGFALIWLTKFFNDIFITTRLPTEFKKTKVIAILKKGKPANEASSYRPISLLSVCYKILEKMVYKRIYSTIENVLPPEQAGFRPNRNCCDQVLSLTTHIEDGFQRRQKTGAVFVDLTAAYDTVWKDGLVHKLYNTIPCGQTVRLLESMLSNRRFRVFIGETSSKFKTLNNGLPQGAVLSPLLFNLYTSDLPITNSRKFIYADDLALAYQDQDFTTIEKNLTQDLNVMNDYFKKWRLCPNASKTEVTCFHLCNNQRNRELNIFNGSQLKHNFTPVYLGVTLDGSLTYKHYLEKLRQKLKTRNNILLKLAGSSWGANAQTLRISALALVFSSAEYCAPVWLNSTHTTKINEQLNTSMRIITGTLKSTPIPWLSTLSNIAPPDLRRKDALKKLWIKYKQFKEEFPIWQNLQTPINRLPSRKPFWKCIETIEDFSVKEEWRSNWRSLTIINKELIEDPSQAVTGFNQPRKIWCQINRLRTGHGRCNDLLFKWGSVESPLCDCGATETISHIVEDCRFTRLEGGFHEIHYITPAVLEWLPTLKLL